VNVVVDFGRWIMDNVVVVVINVVKVFDILFVVQIMKYVVMQLLYHVVGHMTNHVNIIVIAALIVLNRPHLLFAIIVVHTKPFASQ
jgi:hypothetical protein